MSNVLIAPAEPEEPKRFIFKSKFREDKVTLYKPHVELNPYGSKSVEGHKMAEFMRNTWSTDDPLDAEKLRTVIRNRTKRGASLGVVETTDIDAPGKPDKKTSRKV